ncbi:hypothetical protein CRYUN_Cryun10bG0107200 [Craigia yunnanensis]
MFYLFQLPWQEVIPILEKKLSDTAAREVILWFMEEKTNDITKQACVDTNLSTPWGYVNAIVLCVATFGTVTSGFFLKPCATFDDYLADVLPLFGGFVSILRVSEIATIVTAARYGVKTQPLFSCSIQLDRLFGRDEQL